MRKILGLLLALAMVLGTISMTAGSASAAGKYKCPTQLEAKRSVHYRGMNGFVTGVTTVWRGCKHRDRKQYASKIVKQKFWYRDNKGEVDCDGVKEAKYITFDSYFSDTTGRNYNPYRYRLDCQNDGYNEKWLDYSEAPLMLHTKQGKPKWKTFIEVELAYAKNPDSDTVGGYLDLVIPYREAR